MRTLHSVEVVERSKLRRLVEKNPALPPPGQSDAEVVGDELPWRYTEDVIEFLTVYCKLLPELTIEFT